MPFKHTTCTLISESKWHSHVSISQRMLCTDLRSRDLRWSVVYPALRVLETTPGISEMTSELPSHIPTFWAPLTHPHIHTLFLMDHTGLPSFCTYLTVRKDFLGFTLAHFFSFCGRVEFSRFFCSALLLIIHSASSFVLGSFKHGLSSPFVLTDHRMWPRAAWSSMNACCLDSFSARLPSSLLSLWISHKLLGPREKPSKFFAGL